MQGPPGSGRLPGGRPHNGLAQTIGEPPLVCFWAAHPATANASRDDAAPPHPPPATIASSTTLDLVTGDGGHRRTLRLVRGHPRRRTTPRSARILAHFMSVRRERVDHMIVTTRHQMT